MEPFVRFAIILLDSYKVATLDRWGGDSEALRLLTGHGLRRGARGLKLVPGLAPNSLAAELAKRRPVAH
jgi:hypothetical protein